MTPENFAIIHAKEQNEIMLNEDSFEEELENGDDEENSGENFEENNSEEMNEDENDEDEEMDQEDGSSDDENEVDNSNDDHMDEDQSESEVVVPVELEDFEKLLQSKELVMKSLRRTQKQNNNGETMQQYDNEDSVEDIWKPVHQGFGTGIGVLLNGQLPNLDLPAELDELKGGKLITIKWYDIVYL